jgi:hypothetical protein
MEQVGFNTVFRAFFGAVGGTLLLAGALFYMLDRDFAIWQQIISVSLGIILGVWGAWRTILLTRH